MRIIGRIHTVDVRNKLIGIIINKRVVYFYFQNSQMNIFKRYLYPGNWIEMEYEEDRKTIKGHIESYVVSFVYKILAISKYDKVVYYDKRMLNQSLSSFLKSLGNVMFLDLEMTMPSYNFKGKGVFKAEMIQAGYIVYNGEGEELCHYNKYVKPVLNPHLSRRVEEFLGITQLDFNAQAIEYSEFYEEFVDTLNQYNPTIVVYGRNDILVLKDSYDINNKPSLVERTRFVNLCQLLKNYYDLRNDPGLFKMYKTFYEIDDLQVHDALGDSEVTALVFKAFKDDVNCKTDFSAKVRSIFD